MRYNDSHISELVGKAISFLTNHSKGMVYLECEGMNDLDISLIVAPSKKVETFLVDANFYREDLLIEVVVVHNPKASRGESLVWMEWSLNEIIAHEVCHYHQYLEGRLPRKGNRELPPEKYFLQKHEVEAQVEGWGRVSRTTGVPVLECAEIWFRRNVQFHGMEESKWKKIIEKVFFLRDKLVL